MKVFYCRSIVNVKRFQYDRLCEDSADVKNSISLQMIGVLIGTAIFGQISDAVGRKLVIIIYFLLSKEVNVWVFLQSSECSNHR